MSEPERDLAFFNYKQATHRLLADSKGEPLTVYHATSKRFELFRPLSHFGSYQAACGRIKGSYSETKHLAFSMFESAGSENNILNAMTMFLETVKDIKDKKEVKRYENEPYYIPAHLALYNPKLMVEMGFYRSGYKTDLMYRLIREQMVFQFRFYKHVRTPYQKNMALAQVLSMVQVPPIYDFIFKNPFKIKDEAVRYELGLETLYPILGVHDTNLEYKGLKKWFPNHPLHKNMFVNRMNLSMQRMIRYWEAQGYDGFIYEDTQDDTVPERTGLDNTINNKTLPCFDFSGKRASFSYVIFRPGQVIRLDRDGSYLMKPIYPPVKNQQKLDEIQTQTLSQMMPRRLTVQEKSNISAWHLENARFYRSMG